MPSPPIDGSVERALTLSGSVNCRDLGGLPVSAGGHTRFGVLLRSDALLTLTPADAERLRRLPLTTVIDLREEGERMRDRSALSGRGGIDEHHVPIWQPIHDAGWPPVDPWDLSGWYHAALDHAGAAFALAVERLAASSGAALFHCTVGKDRTGLLAALVLEGVGVGRGDVVGDYVLTHDRIDPIRARLVADAEAHGIDPVDFARLLGAEAETLASALEHLDRRYGGAAAYLLAAGVREESLARLSSRLVEHAPADDGTTAEHAKDE
ncbi:MAG: tyrosine-protein phosphatase [Trueperaceae bacterium]|nr:MAG: tyrosine-protein phosphatase [Trueperaceae bacterium]